MKVERRLDSFAAGTSYSCPEPSSDENTFDECHERCSGQYQLLLTVRHDRSTKNNQFALPVEVRIAHCPIRCIRLIRSLMTRSCAPRGRVQGRVISEKRVVPSTAEFIAPSARRNVVRSCRQTKTHLTNATNGAADKTSFYSQSGPD